MDDSGRIYRRCECGADVTGDRECPKCGEKSTTADDLSAMFRKAITDEMLDPLTAMRDQLRKQHWKLQRKGR